MSLKYRIFYLFALFLKNVCGGDLTFVIDVTTSMENEIRAIKNNIGKILDTVELYKNENEIDKLIIVTYSDLSEQFFVPDTKVIAKTKDRSEFIAALNQVNTIKYIGGLCPELTLMGIEKALEESAPRSTIYVFTDATSKDYYYLESVKRLALEKQCQIIFVVTGSSCDEAVTSRGYQVYHDIATATNGQVFRIQNYEIGKVLDYVKAILNGRRTPLANINLPAGENSFTFNTDTLMKDVVLSMTSDYINSPYVTIESPDGTVVNKQIFLNTPAVQGYSVNVTKPGLHIVKVNSPLTYTQAVISSNSQVDFKHGFSSFIPTKLADTSIRPFPAVPSFLTVQLTKGDIDLTSVRILDMDEKVIQEIPLVITNGAQKLYTSQLFDPPQTTFKFAITGFDPASNTTVVRLANTPVEVQKILKSEQFVNKTPVMYIEGEKVIKVKYGESAQFICKVEGYPIPSIVWKDILGNVVSNQVLPGKNFPYDYVNVLSIGKSYTDATYTCHAFQDNKIYYNYTDVTLEIMTHLNIENKRQNETVECGAKQAKFLCTVVSSPSAKITWYKDNAIVRGDDHISLSVDNSILLIKDPTAADRGTYICEASNGKDTQRLINYLNVNECREQVVIDKSVTTLTIVGNQRTEVECKILKGKPKPSISWKIETPDKYILDIDQWKNHEKVVIEGASKIDPGNYTCEAQNNFSKDTHSISIFVD